MKADLEINGLLLPRAASNKSLGAKRTNCFLKTLRKKNRRFVFPPGTGSLSAWRKQLFRVICFYV
jgi:hypothetical protein